MSGIFKGDSIYKSGGGGGGGYKDGGQLVDGDFIEVKNNTVSSYDNVSRDPVNFYFEAKDGEVLNSVIELTTAVNATINVYVVRNGLYYLLGNVDGNTVNAGEDYKVNITDDSFSIEEVSSEPIPSFFEFENFLYPIIKVGSLLWLCSNLKGSSYNHYTIGDTDYYEINPDININGWRIPTKTECNALIDEYGAYALKSTSGWYNSINGDNSSGFNLYPKSWYRNNFPINPNNPTLEWNGSIMTTTGFAYLVYNETSFYMDETPANDFPTIRLVKDV
jgi:uncharacterized protein (TIGR02145 family)